MKSKKGFTLIELLAIIVILAIIAVITVPIILGIIDNSKKGAAIDSAYGYKDAVNRYYVTKSLENTNQEFPSGYKFVSDMPSDFDVFGKKPTDGWVKLNKGSVEEFSLKFGDYVVNLDSSKVIEAIRDGEIVLTPDQQLIKDMKDKALAYVNDLKVAKGTVTN